MSTLGTLLPDKRGILPHAMLCWSLWMGAFREEILCNLKAAIGGGVK